MAYLLNQPTSGDSPSIRRRPRTSYILRENVCNVIICLACILMKCERHIIRLDKVFRAVQASGGNDLLFYLDKWQFSVWIFFWFYRVKQSAGLHSSVNYYGIICYLHFGRWLLFNKHFWLSSRNIQHTSLLSSKHEKEIVLSENLPDIFLTCADNGWSMQDPCRVKCFANLIPKRRQNISSTLKASFNCAMYKCIFSCNPMTLNNS